MPFKRRLDGPGRRRGLVWEIRRVLLVPALLLRRDAVRSTRGLAHFCCVGCTPKEAAQATALSTAQVLRLVDAAACYLGSAPIRQTVRVFCLGSELDTARVPCRMGPVLAERGSAFWWPSLRAVFVHVRSAATSEESLWRTLLHELSHAIMDLTSRPYTYPRTNRESFAMTMATLISKDASDRMARPWPTIPPIEPARCVPLDDLIAPEGLFADEGIPDSEGRFHWSSYWLLSFLAVMSHSTGGELRDLLVGLRQHGLRGQSAYDWIVTRFRMTPQQFDREFRNFCMAH